MGEVLTQVDEMSSTWRGRQGRGWPKWGPTSCTYEGGGGAQCLTRQVPGAHQAAPSWSSCERGLAGQQGPLSCATGPHLQPLQAAHAAQRHVRLPIRKAVLEADSGQVQGEALWNRCGKAR